MKELRKEIEKLVENEDFVSYEEFIFELEEEKEEVKKFVFKRGEYIMKKYYYLLYLQQSLPHVSQLITLSHISR